MSDQLTMGRNDLEYYPRIGGVAHEVGLSDRAAAELQYVPMEKDFAFLKPSEEELFATWRDFYPSLNEVTVALTCVAVLITVLFWISFVVKASWLTTLVTAGHGRTIAHPLFGLFTILLYNALVTAVFVDPIWRYQYMTMPLQIICASYGCIALLGWSRAVLTLALARMKT